MVSFSICKTAQEQATDTGGFGPGVSALPPALVKRPLLKASKQDFIKASLQSSIDIQMNFFLL